MSDVIGALSYALDMTDGQPAGHALRSCVIGMRLVEACGLNSAGRAAAFYGLLMKDAGCSSNAANVAALYGVDDVAAKRALRTVNYSRFPEAMKYVLRTAGGPADLARVVRAGKRAAAELTEIRCHRGADIAVMLGLPAGASDAIRALGEHWDGKGHPAGLAGEEIPLLARIFCLAQTVEVFVRDFGVEKACEMAERRSGSWFDPALVRELVSFRDDRAFWASLAAGDLELRLGELEPAQSHLIADEVRLDRIAEAFASVIDAKSPYTFQHSSRVAELTCNTARQFGFDAASVRELRRAALLHDIGKLAVSSRILDKPGPLTDAERRTINQHPRLSEEILSKIAPFRGIAALAGAHHERLDGSGYWRGVTGAQLGSGARTLAVADAYEAMTADRPYRAAMRPEQALALLQGDAGDKLCPTAIEALKASLHHPGRAVVAA